MKFYAVLLLSCCAFALYANDAIDRQETQLRIQPIGQVRVQTENPVIAAPSKKDPGQEIYEQHCIVCHKDGLAGAPKFRNAPEWKPRLVGRTLEDLVTSSIKGLNAMPTKGTCIKCSKDDLKAAIAYMLPKS